MGLVFKVGVVVVNPQEEAWSRVFVEFVDLSDGFLSLLSARGASGSGRAIFADLDM